MELSSKDGHILIQFPAERMDASPYLSVRAVAGRPASEREDMPLAFSRQGGLFVSDRPLKAGSWLVTVLATERDTPIFRQTRRLVIARRNGS